MAIACCEDRQDALSVLWHDAHALAPTNSPRSAAARWLVTLKIRPAAKTAIAVRTAATAVIFQKRALRGVTEKVVSLPNVSLVTLAHAYFHEHLFTLELMH